MKTFFPLIITLFLSSQSVAQMNSAKEFSRSFFSEEISFIRTDSSHGSYSTVIEYPGFLVVLELPMINAGGGVIKNLRQDIPKAERFLAFLESEYQNKPVKLVLSSHWHLHSLSGITPFLKRGTKLVTAKANWEYSITNGLLDSTFSYSSQIISLTQDTTLLTETAFPISVIFLDESYKNKPTKEYLFFYFPENKALHASCMCALNEINFSQQPEFIYNNRLIDLEKAIKSHNLKVEYLFKLTSEAGIEKNTYKLPWFSASYFEEFLKRGKSSEVVIKNLSKVNLDSLTSEKDKIISYLIEKNIPGTLVNSLVYRFIKEKKYDEAVQWAQILNLYHIGNSDFLDTMGEAYYNTGNMIMAQLISNQLTKLKPEFQNQFKVWKETKEKEL